MSVIMQTIYKKFLPPGIYQSGINALCKLLYSVKHFNKLYMKTIDSVTPFARKTILSPNIFVVKLSDLPSVTTR